MSIRDRDIDDWFRRWGLPWWGSGSSRGIGTGSMFREFEDMGREMERMFEQTTRDIDKVPKELVREYNTPGGGRVREVGPLVYGYSMTIGPDGKPRVKEFGNVRSLGEGGPGGVMAPAITAEREPLSDIITTDSDVKVTVEMPGISKQDIKIKAYDSSVEVSTIESAPRKYRRLIELPPDAGIETAKSTYTNGILEIAFKKKGKPKGKEIKID
ncbi:MAG: Hsp20/alpha crystallin family protein [Thermoproteota archaeon]|nr:Hsp20/alpha crystallin family protein [Thermoproteota archaeon]